MALSLNLLLFESRESLLSLYSQAYARGHLSPQTLVLVTTIKYFLTLHCHSREFQIFAKMLVHGLLLTIPMSKLILMVILFYKQFYNLLWYLL